MGLFVIPEFVRTMALRTSPFLPRTTSCPTPFLRFNRFEPLLIRTLSTDLIALLLTPPCRIEHAPTPPPKWRQDAWFPFCRHICVFLPFLCFSFRPLSCIHPLYSNTRHLPLRSALMLSSLRSFPVIHRFCIVHLCRTNLCDAFSRTLGTLI